MKEVEPITSEEIYFKHQDEPYECNFGAKSTFYVSSVRNTTRVSLIERPFVRGKVV